MANVSVSDDEGPDGWRHIDRDTRPTKERVRNGAGTSAVAQTEAREIRIRRRCPYPLPRAHCWARRASFSVAEWCRRHGRAVRAQSTLGPCNAGPWRGQCIESGFVAQGAAGVGTTCLMIIGLLRCPFPFPPAPLSSGLHLAPLPTTTLPDPTYFLHPPISMKDNTVRIPLPSHDATYHTWLRLFSSASFDVSIYSSSPLLRAHLEGGRPFPPIPHPSRLLSVAHFSRPGLLPPSLVAIYFPSISPLSHFSYGTP